MSKKINFLIFLLQIILKPSNFTQLGSFAFYNKDFGCKLCTAFVSDRMITRPFPDYAIFQDAVTNQNFPYKTHKDLLNMDDVHAMQKIIMHRDPKNPDRSYKYQIHHGEDPNDAYLMGFHGYAKFWREFGKADTSKINSVEEFSKAASDQFNKLDIGIKREHFPVHELKSGKRYNLEIGANLPPKLSEITAPAQLYPNVMHKDAMADPEFRKYFGGKEYPTLSTNEFKDLVARVSAKQFGKEVYGNNWPSVASESFVGHMRTPNGEFIEIEHTNPEEIRRVEGMKEKSRQQWFDEMAENGNLQKVKDYQLTSEQYREREDAYARLAQRRSPQIMSMANSNNEKEIGPRPILRNKSALPPLEKPQVPPKPVLPSPYRPPNNILEPKGNILGGENQPPSRNILIPSDSSIKSPLSTQDGENNENRGRRKIGGRSPLKSRGSKAPGQNNLIPAKNPPSGSNSPSKGPSSGFVPISSPSTVAGHSLPFQSANANQGAVRNPIKIIPPTPSALSKKELGRTGRSKSRPRNNLGGLSAQERGTQNALKSAAGLKNKPLPLKYFTKR